MSLFRILSAWLVMLPALAGLGVVAVDLMPGGPIGAGRQWGFDTWQRVDRAPESRPRVVIVDIDDAALAAGGRWPWSRETLARILRPLDAARVVGIDILLREPERATPSADEDLAAALRGISAVLAVGTVPRVLPSIDSSPERKVAMTPVRERGDEPAPFLPRAGVALPPLTLFADASAGLGVSIIDGPDAVVRTLPGVILVDGSRWPGFAVEVLRVAAGAQDIELDAGPMGVRQIETGVLVLPTTPAGGLNPRFAYARRTPRISASKLLDGSVDAGVFKGCIVLVGVDASGAGRMLATPLGSAMSSTAVEAAVIESALDHRLLARPPLVVWGERLAALLLSALAAALLGRGTYRLHGALLVAGLMMPPAISAWAFFGPGLMIDWVMPLAAMVATGVATLGRLATVASDAKREQAQAQAAARSSAVAQRRELALREEADAARESLSLALDAAHLGVWDADLATGTWRHSPHYLTILGLPKVSERWNVAEMIGPIAAENRAEAAAALTGQGQARFDFECVVGENDEAREIRVAGRVWRDGRGKVCRVAGVVADITRQREMERRLRQAERVQAVGLLAGGVAHNFNNLLTIIVGKLDLARRPLDDASPTAELMEGAMRAAERGTHVARHLLAFARGQTIAPRKVTVATSLQDVAALLQDSLPSSVSLQVDLADDLGAVEVDPGELDLALLNLVINARDAMPMGGNVRIEARRQSIHRPASGLDGQYVVISVIDDGPGVAPSVLARVFEPFVTTKPPAFGTGLGLSQVHGFVHQAGGVVDIVSKQGEGTAVRLYLPSITTTAADGGSSSGQFAKPAAVPSPKQAHVADANLPTGRSAVSRPDGAAQDPTKPTVLIVEDDLELCSIAAEVLAAEGYSVATAHRGLDALALLRSGRRFDLLFSDIVMPGGMTGMELAAIAKREFPSIRVMLTTGYSQEILEGEMKAMPVLMKPYRAEELCRNVGALLAPAETIRELS